MTPDPRDADLKNIDDVVKRYLPSAPKEQMESDAARVLDRLRSMADQAVDLAEEERVADPVSVPAWRRFGMAGYGCNRPAMRPDAARRPSRPITTR